MITIQDVAKRAGVPIKTASRAIAGLTQGKRRDAKERAERVLKAALELGYQPSTVAQALRNGKTKTIGMVVGGLSNKYFGCVVEAFLDELDKHGYRLLLEATKWDEEREYECLKDLLRHRVDGIVYLCDLPEKLRLEHHIMLERGFPLLTVAANDHGFGTVKNNFAAAIAAAVAFLHKKHTDLGLVLHYGQRIQNIEIEKAFRLKCAELGVEASVYCLGRSNDVGEITKKRHQAWLIDGPYVLLRILKSFSAADSGYKPDVIGFYDDFNWELRPETLCGAVVRQTGKIIETVVKETIARIEAKIDEPRNDIVFPAEFVTAKDFGNLQFRPLPSEYIV